MSLPPLALYVHIPWCVRKCPYCDFNSHTLSKSEATEGLDAATEKDYVLALLADLDHEIRAWPELQQRPLTSIFFGGGTPSLMSPVGYEAFFEGLQQRLQLSADCEITLEANPGTVEQSRFTGYRAAGINRLSMGVQSFATPQLQALGRIHSGKEAIHAAEAALLAGFDNFNLDLMHGLPQQTPELALADLQQALALQPKHLSWYQLTLEPNTEFFRRPPVLPEEDLLVEIQDAGAELLSAAGYQNYEVSAYALPGFQAKHNLNYWQFGDYLGLGAGAHGKLTRPDPQQAGGLQLERRWKTRQPQAYLSRLLEGRDFLAGSEMITADQRPVEFMMNALRLKEGVAAQLYSERTGLPVDALKPLILALQQQGLWTQDPDRLACSELGWRWLNQVLEKFLITDEE
ncbi:oxygen-independent coproporphyrinogen-3 oxidase [Marinospirillum celere]|uniref:Heme chaperone HemW n=1 Tax=Marinospirillum celere TaxID=1122252 RepID=A0A1I1HRG5_9GAMM|nr:radical SAM family heme chaperone HemW [Marinospirillum celere]SFC26456.1 oxygen-independent coproporphyrinogen-3 oxidase [Marinospirillum celere]